MAEKTKLSWEDIERCTRALAEKLKDCKFDAVVAIGRGGMVPARLLAEELDIHTAYVVDAKAYSADDKLGEMKIKDLLIDSNVHSVLVVDDVIFTGITLDAVMAKLAEYECITSITNAFLYKNSKTSYDSASYAYAEEYDGDKLWLVFPWERN